MTKRNQFCLSIIGLLGRLMFFYLLGTFAFEYNEKHDLLVKIDNAIVSSQEPTESLEIKSSDFLFENAFIHTQLAKSIAMNVKEFNQQPGMSIQCIMPLKMVIMEGTQVTNYFLDKPPRLRMNLYDTS